MLDKLAFSISDFELAVINALSLCYPRILVGFIFSDLYIFLKIIGCFFHYVKCLLEKYQEWGWLKNSDGFETPQFKQAIVRFLYLGFSKLDDIVVCFEMLMDELGTLFNFS